MLRLLIAAGYVLALLALGLASPTILAGERLQAAQISGDPDKPKRHFRIRRPARLAPAEAEEVYQQLIDGLVAGYAPADHPVTRDYRSWRRYNSAPAAEGSTLLNDLYTGREVDETRMTRLLSLFRLDFGDSRVMRPDIAGRPVYLAMAMSEDSRLRLKPQNLLVNLPLAEPA